jgi:hypothetical protein
MKKLLNSARFRALIATVVSFSFMIYPRLGTAPPVMAAGIDLRSESQVKTEAALYDSAMRTIEQGLTIKLETLDDLKAATALLEKQIPNLKFNRSKLAQIALSDTTFVGAVGDRVKDSKTTDTFASELATDPNTILKLNGASALADRLQTKVETDVSLIRKVANRLQQAGADLKAKIKQAHASRSGVGLSTNTISPAAPSPPPLVVRLDGVVFLLVVAAIAYPGLAIALAVLATGPLAPAVVAGLLIAKLVENLGTDKGKDKVAKCQEAVDAHYQICFKAGADACCGLAILNAEACLAIWMYDSAGCLLS